MYLTPQAITNVLRHSSQSTRRLALGTRVKRETETPEPRPRRRFARSESEVHDTKHVDVRQLLDNTLEKQDDEDQQWDDYTQVEAALFLPPAW